MEDESNLCDLHALTEHLKLPLWWIKAEAKAGRIPCLQIGRQFLFNRASVIKELSLRAARETCRSNSKEVALAR